MRLGTAEGIKDGTTVGSAVGAAEGFGVGATVGLARTSRTFDIIIMSTSTTRIERGGCGQRGIELQSAGTAGWGPARIPENRSMAAETPSGLARLGHAQMAGPSAGAAREVALPKQADGTVARGEIPLRQRRCRSGRVAYLYRATLRSTPPPTHSQGLLVDRLSAVAPESKKAQGDWIGFGALHSGEVEESAHSGQMDGVY